MSLIKCPECGKEISDKASVCINCGYPISQYNSSSIIKNGDDKSDVEKECDELLNSLTNWFNDLEKEYGDYYSCFINSEYFTKLRKLLKDNHVSSIHTKAYETLLKIYFDMRTPYMSYFSWEFESIKRTFEIIDFSLVDVEVLSNIPDEIVDINFLNITQLFAYLLYQIILYVPAEKNVKFYEFLYQESPLLNHTGTGITVFDLLIESLNKNNIPILPKVYELNNSSKKYSKTVVRCPKCGSTSIQTMQRGYHDFFGWFGSSQIVNVCQSCGCKFSPGN